MGKTNDIYRWRQFVATIHWFLCVAILLSQLFSQVNPFLSQKCCFSQCPNDFQVELGILTFETILLGKEILRCKHVLFMTTLICQNYFYARTVPFDTKMALFSNNLHKCSLLVLSDPLSQSHVNQASFIEHTFDLGQVLDGRSLVTSEAFVGL